MPNLPDVIAELLEYRAHKPHCQIEVSDCCTCGMKQAAERARVAANSAASLADEVERLRKLLEVTAIRGSYTAAIHCIQEQQRNNTYRESMLAEVISCDSVYKDGDWVLVQDVTLRDCTIEMPMTPLQIKEQRSKGSLLTTWLTCVGFPVSRLRICGRGETAKRVRAATEPMLKPNPPAVGEC